VNSFEFNNDWATFKPNNCVRGAIPNLIELQERKPRIADHAALTKPIAENLLLSALEENPLAPVA
jgi:hypothetical protein